MERIDEQAARWAVRIAAGPPSVQLQRELDAWLEKNPRHRGAYVRAQAHWLDLDRLAVLHGPVSERALATRPAPVATRRAPSTARRRWLMGAAASLVGVGGGLAWMLAPSRLHYRSGLGELRRIPLADGSVVLLNTESEMLVEFGERVRHIGLLRGEALFQVQHDRARPFVVTTGAVSVRAVGTSFDVRLEPHQLEVTVTEGTVELAHSAAAASRRTPERLTVSERAVVRSPSAIEITAIGAADAERRLAWQHGMVSFNKESLQTAVAEINRYNRRQIVIDDPRLAARPIVGVFRTNDLDDFARAAAEALDAVVVVDEQRLRLRPRDDDAADGQLPEA